MKPCCENVTTPYCPICGSEIVIPPVFDNDVQKVAVMLHQMFCSSSHTDMCGWHYEINDDGIHDWTRGDHQSWYKKAVQILDRMAKEEFLEWAEEAKFVKKVVHKF